MKKIEAPENATKLLVDIRGVMYAAYFWAKKNYNIENVDEIKSAILHRVFEKIKVAHSYANTNRVIFCCDSRSSRRKELYSDYKGRRTKDEHFDSYRDFFLEIQNEILPNMGFSNVLEAEGLEADDIIASICMQESKLPVVIFADDADLYQCIKQNVSQMSITKSSNEACLMYPAKFLKLFGISHNRWADVKALAGCPTDNIPGVKGIGEGKAIAYLNGKMSNGICKARIEQSADVIALTDKLVRLPFNGEVIPFEWEPDNFNTGYIALLVAKYNLQLLESTFWEKFFGFKK